MKIGRLDLARDADARAVLRLQRRAYRVEAELIGFDGIPPLHESLAQLRRCGEIFLGATIDEELAGVVSWVSDGRTIDIHRLAVDPRFFRRGVARALVRAVVAAAPAATRAIVQTGASNRPARALYLDEGFRLVAERDVVPGLRVALFERALP